MSRRSTQNSHCTTKLCSMSFFLHFSILQNHFFIQNILFLALFSASFAYDMKTFIYLSGSLDYGQAWGKGESLEE
jgi:hypothetical protein